MMIVATLSDYLQNRKMDSFPRMYEDDNDLWKAALDVSHRGEISPLPPYIILSVLPLCGACDQKHLKWRSR